MLFCTEEELTYKKGGILNDLQATVYIGEGLVANKQKIFCDSQAERKKSVRSEKTQRKPEVFDEISFLQNKILQEYKYTNLARGLSVDLLRSYIYSLNQISDFRNVFNLRNLVKAETIALLLPQLAKSSRLNYSEPKIILI